ncbi:MAG: Gfo/Idh/MocA family oxidoreductase [Oscillospiraceae bacterium]|nr:Gfo/Idh/MocA family oxidoreductase [Oscillospiraceae bacterium]
MSKTNIAVIGCGSIANNAHIPSYMAHPECEILYFCDIIPERAKAAVEKFGCGKAVTDYREILKDNAVDAVSVCTPNNVHAPISIDFLRAGKHVLCEKPAARTYTEALEMQKACHETGNILIIGVVSRFRQGVNRIKKLIDAGELGEVYQLYASFRGHRSIPGLGGAFTTKEIAGGGVLIDWGVHFLDLMMYCTGDPMPKSVSGHAHSVLGKKMNEYAYADMWAGPPDFSGTYDVDDFVTAIIKTKGPVITLNGAWAQNIGVDEMYIDFLGDKAGIRFQYNEPFILYSQKDGALTETAFTYSGTELDVSFQAEIDAFIRSIKTGEKLPSHIDSVIITAQIMQAIYDSSETGKEIVF